MNFKLKNIRRHFITFLFALWIATTVLGAIGNYHYDDMSLFGILGYVGIILFSATIMILCCRKWRIMRPYVIIFAIPLLLISGLVFLARNRTTTTDLSDYLQADTSFHEVASMFLPTEEEIAEADHVNYQHTEWLFEREYISISMQYDQHEFAKIKARLSDSHARAIGTHYGKPYYWDRGKSFFLNGLIYQTYDLVYEHSYYAFAAGFCEETGGMSFIFLSDPDLASIAVVDVIDMLDIA